MAFLELMRSSSPSMIPNLINKNLKKITILSSIYQIVLLV